MKKHFKGFTLIECLIALAILGIASLTMAQIYAGVSRRNRSNQLVNTSLSNQMAYVEKYTDAETVKVYFNEISAGVSGPDHNLSTNKPPHKGTSGNTHGTYYVEIKKVVNDTGTLSTTDIYSYPIDMFVLYSRDNNDKDSQDAGFSAQYKDFFTDGTKTEDDYNLRYKYFVGHNN